jgi:predicted ArsR family transcriptional regulator
MKIMEIVKRLQRRRDLALRLASRPSGVTTKELARALDVSEQTARNQLAELCSEGFLAYEQAAMLKVQSPGRPPSVFRRRRAAA